MTDRTVFSLLQEVTGLRYDVEGLSIKGKKGKGVYSSLWTGNPPQCYLPPDKGKRAPP